MVVCSLRSVYRCSVGFGLPFHFVPLRSGWLVCSIRLRTFGLRLWLFIPVVADTFGSHVTRSFTGSPRCGWIRWLRTLVLRLHGFTQVCPLLPFDFSVPFWYSCGTCRLRVPFCVYFPTFAVGGSVFVVVYVTLFRDCGGSLGLRFGCYVLLLHVVWLVWLGCVTRLRYVVGWLRSLRFVAPVVVGSSRCCRLRFGCTVGLPTFVGFVVLRLRWCCCWVGYTFCGFVRLFLLFAPVPGLLLVYLVRYLSPLRCRFDLIALLPLFTRCFVDLRCVWLYVVLDLVVPLFCTVDCCLRYFVVCSVVCWTGFNGCCGSDVLRLPVCCLFLLFLVRWLGWNTLVGWTVVVVVYDLRWLRCCIYVWIRYPFYVYVGSVWLVIRHDCSI